MPTVEPDLRRMREEALGLEAGCCWISGDASPPNWGVQPDGSVVLFDWELFQRGVRATDLATTVPDLGDPSAC